MLRSVRSASLSRHARLLAIAALTTAAASAQVQFLGVASGDPTSDSVVLWTRAVDAAAPAPLALLVDVATDAAFGNVVATGAATTDAATSWTAKTSIAGLLPGTRYWYRFSAGGVSSGTGTFRTAPASAALAPVKFAFTGDCDGLMRPYALASVFPSLGLDFFVFLGDTIYETASSGSAAAALTGTVPTPSATGATATQLATDYARKYREQFLSVNPGGQNGLQPLFAAQANYTLLDNHELGNRQYINGGAPPGGTVGGMPTGAGVDARVAANDVNTTGAFINQSLGFQTLLQTYVAWQPVADRGAVVAPADPRTHGTQKLYFSQRWGQNVEFFNVDDRSYRDIRMKTATNTDDTGVRADNPSRTMLGSTQYAWLTDGLLAARDAGVVWKVIALSSPIDQIGAIGSGADGGKSWMGGYRAERNALLKFLVDHRIENVVFLSTDDHQNRVNEVLYSPTGQTGVQSSYVPVPRCFAIVCGPLGATGPDTITNHTFANLSALATTLVNTQTAAGVDPAGLAANFPGLHDVVREGDPNADQNRSPIDFYSPDTFNFATLETTPDGATLTVSVTGIHSRATNSFLEYDAVGNPARTILSFKVDAFTPCAAPVCGQFNTSCATLLVNGAGVAAQGPIPVAVPLGGPLQFAWRGPANQGFVLATSPALVPGQRPFGAAVVDLDLASATPLFGVFDPFLGGLFVTSPQGTASQSFTVPAALRGTGLNVQGVLLDANTECSFGFLTTASFAIAL